MLLDATPQILRTLLRDGSLTEQDVTRAAAAGDGGSEGVGADRSAVSLLDTLVGEGVVNAEEVALARAAVCGYPYVELGTFEIDLRHAELLPRAVAERLRAFPIFVVDGVATVAIADPLNQEGVEQIRTLSRCEVDAVVACPAEIENLIARAYSVVGSGGDDAAEIDVLTTEEAGVASDPVVTAVNQILFAAADVNASDIHVGADEASLHVRYRVDGRLREQHAPPRSAHAAMVQRLKVLAKLDLTESRRPQDGKFRFTHGGRAVDVRLSTMPTVHGENVVMRLLRSASSIGSVEDLGMPAVVESWYTASLERHHGMILVTGPTGSGKTTTLYAGLNRINSPDRNIMTIEDPVEVRLPLIRQVQVRSDLGLSFSGALRSILRQDPDVVLVGEIRDEETARIAVQAALTGHLVLSTLHTNDAVSSVTRLRDLGVPSFAIHGGLLGSLAQRLVRRVCGSCAEPQVVDEHERSLLGIDTGAESVFVRGRGCQKCGGSGYRGRCAVFEAMQMTPRLCAMIDRNAMDSEIAAAASEDGYEPMYVDGLRQAARSVTSLGEVMALAPSHDFTSRRGVGGLGGAGGRAA
ncbi:MAG: ATPase, T2SS/T4P/T4SS family [Planctomycetota bacterium]